MSAPVGTAVTLRRADAADATFLHALSVQSRPEFGVLPAQVVQLQLRAQRAQYRAAHPSSVEEVVEAGDGPVGRCWTATSGRDVHLLDLTVHPGRRGEGIGRAVLQALAGRAAGGAVTLQVWSGNHGARRLYERCGFTVTGETGGYVAMRRDGAGA